MRITPPIRTLGRLAAAVGIVAGLLVASVGTASADFEAPVILSPSAAGGNVSPFPNCIPVNWSHSGSGVVGFSVERQNPYWGRDDFGPDQRSYPVCGMNPSTKYQFQVCAYFGTEDGDVECSGWVELETGAPETPPPPPPAGSGGSSGGTPPLPAAVEKPVLRAAASSGASVDLSWDLPPSGSVVLTHGRLYRDDPNRGPIFEALQQGNYAGRHRDIPLRPNSRHTYMFCFEGPAFGERCSEWVSSGPTPIRPTAPADVTASRVRGGLPATFHWRTTEIPGQFLTVERKDTSLVSRCPPNTPVATCQVGGGPAWRELERISAKDDPTSVTIQETDNFVVEEGSEYRVCAVVPPLGEAGKVCSAPVTVKVLSNPLTTPQRPLPIFP